MRKLQKELLNKKMSLHQALMSMDVLNPDYDKLKREVNRFDDIYDRYMSCCGVEYGTGDIWYSRVRTFEGGCCSEYILTSRKPRKNNRRELVNNPEDQLLGFDTVRETVFGMKKELSIDESVNVKFDYEII